MDVNVHVRITEVVVYPDRARVTAVGKAELTEGVHRLLVDELPLSLEPESVRAGGRGTARVRLLGVDVARQHYVETPAESVRELEARIEELEEQVKALTDEKESWLAHEKYMTGLRQETAEFARGLARGRTSIEAQVQLLTFLREQDLKIRAAMRQLDTQIKAYNRELDKLRRELQVVQSARPRERYQAVVEVEVLAAGHFTLSLSYVTGHAGWRPLYDMRLVETAESNGKSTVLEVTYMAQIIQNTGQDWQDVKLAVSTARPALNQRLPELEPWYIYAHQPHPRMKAMARPVAPMPQSMAESAAPPESVAEPEQVQVAMETAVAEVGSSQTAVTFHISGQTDIPGNGTPRKITMSQFSLPPTIDYLTIPRHTDAVYRRGKVTNITDAPLLAGSVHLFVGEEYIGQNKIEYTPVGGELELLLGVEERIQVERELVKREVDRRRLRDRRQIKYGYKIELHNLLPHTAKIELQDQIPVSRHEEIQVKLEQMSPDPIEISDLHLINWELALAANEKKIVTYEFYIESPRHLTIGGLQD
ncbi:MAG: mucoidy inhibitor MuiA family protein [Chloroflexi bacterium]|nr:MAG: mucoidy inhibitor MuiA family protein [Chloroflexota bacterium]